MEMVAINDSNAKDISFLKKKYFFNSSEDVFLGSGYTFMLEGKTNKVNTQLRKTQERKSHRDEFRDHRAAHQTLTRT